MEKGGKVIASGGYGCVFNPSLRCEGKTKRQNNLISKLMLEKNAKEEFDEINLLKEKLNKIKNYENYFLIYDVSICKPNKLTINDLDEYANKCTALQKQNLNKSNINNELDKLLSLNIPYGGIPVDDYIYENGSFEKLYKINECLMKLLKKGIIPMNEMNIYHNDIKDSNVLVEISNENMKTRLIDWGLSVEYKPNQNNPFPKQWRNRPLQFNIPFSIILFSDLFVEQYTNYLNNGGKVEESDLKPFIINYISEWMKERGAGHYKYINEIMYNLYNHSLISVSLNDRPKVIETQITMDYIVNYLLEVLLNFTKFKENGDLNMRDYLDNVFIKIVDIWGFINIYVPIVDLLSNNYSSLSKVEIQIFNQLKYIFTNYLYNPRSTPIQIKELYDDLKDLGNLFYLQVNNKKKTNISTKTSISYNIVAEGVKKTRKNKNKNKYNRKLIKSNISFKRRPNPKRFKNPILL